MRIRGFLAAVVVALSLAAFSLAPALTNVVEAAPATASGLSFHHSCSMPTGRRAACTAIKVNGGPAARTHTTIGRSIFPSVCSNPSFGYTPCDLVSAYKLPSATKGLGQTVAIVDAFDDPNAESDLGVYRAQFGLPACTTANGCFAKLDQNGGTSYPPGNQGWAEEISLDLDMVSAVCPNCNIRLYEANDNTYANLLTAVDTATNTWDYISNSWSSSEFSGETSFDSHFSRLAPTVYVFATGDFGYGTGYPAASPYVFAAGGTHLVAAPTTTRGWKETAWSGAGSGCSVYEAQPSWQSTVTNITANCSNRAEADFSAVADPNTGVDVYDTALGDSGWEVFGGTSVATPILTSVFGLAGNPSAVEPTPTSGASYLYAHYVHHVYDIKRGSNGSCGTLLCNAVVGWDGPTGWGSPKNIGAF